MFKIATFSDFLNAIGKLWAHPTEEKKRQFKTLFLQNLAICTKLKSLNQKLKDYRQKASATITTIDIINGDFY